MKVVVNNDALGFIEFGQISVDFIPLGTEFKNPNFATLAERSVWRGIRIEDRGEVYVGVAAALDLTGRS